MALALGFKIRTEEREFKLAWTQTRMFLEATNVLQHGPTLCESLIPATVHADLYSSLVCGKNLKPGAAKQLFLDTGLIHLMVVSGAHLLFLEALLARAPLWVRLSCLGFYCWLTGFGAPVVKAFAHRLLDFALNKKGWTGLQVEAAAVVLVLIFYPFWLFSRSFQMSWMCALALSLPAYFKPKSLDQSLKAYALLFVFSGAPLLSIAWNTLVAPFVGVILFPLSLLVIPLPWLVSGVDLVWDLFLKILSLGPVGFSPSWFISSYELFWMAPLLHAYLLVREVRWRRAHAFSC